MYYLVEVSDIVRIPPDKFRGSLERAAMEVLKEAYEGTMNKTLGGILAVVDVKVSPIGKLVHGDGATYHKAVFKLLTYKPLEHEVVEAEVTEVTSFGTFLRLGPLEGLVHVSQVADDYISYDGKRGALICKNSRRVLQKGDIVRARIVTVSLSSGSFRECKVGLTMRQPFLGKLEWIEEDVEKARTPVKGAKPKKPAGV
ncbi:MAG: DNA-directed RNA polymerase [Thermoprotei archaeon]|nr:MAG: DNA-directed RNA polymerase [Thermoprotei archaeon]RLF17082.1 MAG: DNA-directed RNA polymerase [Thermoprotei archaeon]